MVHHTTPSTSGVQKSQGMDYM